MLIKRLIVADKVADSTSHLGKQVIKQPENCCDKGIYAIKGAMDMLSRGKKTSCWEVRQGFPEES